MKCAVWHREKCLSVRAVKNSFMESTNKEDLWYKIHGSYTTIRRFYIYNKSWNVYQSFAGTAVPIAIPGAPTQPPTYG